MDNARCAAASPPSTCSTAKTSPILASVALLSRAFGILSHGPRHPVRGARAPGVHAGRDGRHPGPGARPVPRPARRAARSAGDIAVTNELKTGVLLGAAVDMAAIVAQADDAWPIAARLRAGGRPGLPDPRRFPGRPRQRQRRHRQGHRQGPRQGDLRDQPSASRKRGGACWPTWTRPSATWMRRRRPAPGHPAFRARPVRQGPCRPQRVGRRAAALA
jgi:hypothetical protein